MRTSQRNRRDIYYALYQGVTNVVDDDGNYTGEQAVSYTTPTKARMNVSGGRGQAEIDTFGIDNPFSRSAVTEDLDTAFDTDTIWWVDVIPGATADEVAHDYRCTGVSRTINQTVIALAEVDVSEEDND